jgi:hypothetical protein
MAALKKIGAMMNQRGEGILDGALIKKIGGNKETLKNGPIEKTAAIG